MSTRPTSPQAGPEPASPGLSPAGIARYLQGAPPEMSQYEFFVGDWDCQLRAYPAGDGAPVIFRGEWRAKWVHQGRMLLDDLSVFLPSGEEVLGWLNLRTYSEETGCWEISGQRALGPCSGAITHGHWREGEMHLDFETAHTGRVMQNLVRFHAITPQSFEWEWKHRGSASSDDWRLFASLSARRAGAGPARA